jgi:hypothetical protein
VTKGHHFQQGRLKLLAGQGIGVVQPRRGNPPALGDGANGQVFFKAEPQQLDTLDGFRAMFDGPPLVELGGLGHERLRPGALERDELRCSAKDPLASDGTPQT